MNYTVARATLFLTVKNLRTSCSSLTARAGYCLAVLGLSRWVSSSHFDIWRRGMNRLIFLLAVVVATTRSASVQGQAGRRGEVLDANTASEKDLLSVPGHYPGACEGHPRPSSISDYDRAR